MHNWLDILIFLNGTVSDLPNLLKIRSRVTIKVVQRKLYLPQLRINKNWVFYPNISPPLPPEIRGKYVTNSLISFMS